jgi:ribosomal protein L17
MRHRNKNKILDRQKGPRELMLRNLASSILLYEKVKTTKAKAQAVRPLVERLITSSKAGDLNARRGLLSTVAEECRPQGSRGFGCALLRTSGRLYPRLPSWVSVRAMALRWSRSN